MELKQVLVIRADLKMSKGKIGAQCAHASLEAAENSSKNMVAVWRSEGAKKVVLRVDSEKELLALQRKAKAEKLVATLIRDAGHTEVAPGTITTLGIGPDSEIKIDKVTGSLKAL